MSRIKSLVCSALKIKIKRFWPDNRQWEDNLRTSLAAARRPSAKPLASFAKLRHALGREAELNRGGVDVPTRGHLVRVYRWASRDARCLIIIP